MGATTGKAGPPMEVSVERLRSILYRQGGQTTAEYSLVLLVAALIVGVFAAFAKSGALSELFNDIVSGLMERAQG